MYNYFKEYHPISVFLYTIGILILILFINHPFYICTALVTIIIHITLITNIKHMIKSIFYSLPILIVVIIINPLFNHKGNTPLFYYDEQVFTLEALLYGIFTASLILCFLLWCRLFNLLIDSYRILYLFGKLFSTSTLMVTMIMRFLPYYKYQLYVISSVQKPLIHTTKQNIVAKIKKARNTFSCITSISLEDSIDTADSMKARGYGLCKRTHYEKYNFLLRDWFLILFILITFVTILFGIITNVFQFDFFPEMTSLHLNKINRNLIILFFIYVSLPIFINISEVIKWTLSKQKI